ncbi:hypothetical protein G6F56_000708 [Rhizopus delemar]|nr:hypothetical protein G6F56_000708 [Rhizopus delemar]
MSKFNNKEKKPVTKDPRFSGVHNDPRFLRPKKQDTKVTIDKRFASMMNSTEFSDAPRVDKYGRKVKQDTAEKQLKRYYKMEEENEDDESEEEKTLEELEKELAEDEENIRDEMISATGYDPMRGRGEISSSESDETDDESDLDSEPDELDAIQRIEEGDETSRLALVNMDWDKIKAVDILKALNGFKPDTGIIKSVTIYPSEFGKERLASEEVNGPPKDIFKKKEESDNEDDEEEITEETIIKNQLEEGDGRDFDQDALRKYQLDRLKYYYAVIECDSPKTAKVIYKSCDNTEYESSANFFDLRYVPEDMPFDDEIKDKATIVPDNYTPTKFTTEALQRTKVTLTWDEDDVDRFRVTRRDFTQDDIKDFDFDAYLASSDEDDEEEDVEALKAKYKKLLGAKNGNAYKDHVDEDEDEDEGDMEITFTPGLSEAAGAAVKNRQDHGDQEDKEETSIEKYMRKVKEKKKAKKASKQPETSKEDEDDSDMDAETENDPYFKEAMTEMETEGFADIDEKNEKKKKKKRASKEEREQKARDRAELELLMGDAQDEGFNMKEVLKKEKMEKKKKGKKGKKEESTQDDFDIDVSDPRFAAIQESHHFAIDPTNPQFKKTKSMKKLLDARHTKMKEDTNGEDEWKKSSAKPTKDSKSSLQQLVASVKRKGALNEKTSSGKRQKQ